MEATNWAPEHSAALRDFFAKGMSFAKIARAINATFNTTYSRNAALGRAKRMGLGGSGRPGTPPFVLPQLNRQHDYRSPMSGQRICDGQNRCSRLPSRSN